MYNRAAKPKWDAESVAHNDRIAREQSVSPQKTLRVLSANETSQSFRELYCQDEPARDIGGPGKAEAYEDWPSIAETYLKTTIGADGSRTTKRTSRHQHNHSITEGWQTVELKENRRVVGKPETTPGTTAQGPTGKEEVDDVEEDLISFKDILLDL